jgi:uncharacterized protein (TIGR02145 family)
MRTILKLTLVFIFVVFSMSSFSQVPQEFNYQLILRNSSGNIIANKSIVLKASIVKDADWGDIVYSELHEVSSNEHGLIALRIGDGEVEDGTFETISWGAGVYALEVEIDMLDGEGFIQIGSSQLVAVPYALHAQTVENNDDADADPENELQVLSINGDTIFLENGGYIILPTDKVEDADADATNEIQELTISSDTIFLTEGGFIKLPADQVNDFDADTTNELQTISFANDSLEISLGNKIKIPITDTTWRFQGSDLYFNAGKVGIGTNSPSTKLIVKGDETTETDDLLFAVVNNAGDTVFAVFQGGVRIYVDDNPAKAVGNKGGFAVGGFSSGKGTTNDFLHISPDSVRIYVDENSSKAVGNKGGFAIGGFNSGKAFSNNEFLRVTPDSTRVYVKESATKGTKGGFAISGISNTKTISGNFLDITPINAFIGQDAGKSNTTGERNAFMGYQAGLSNTTGVDNVFIGNEAGLSNEEGFSNIFLGTNSGSSNISGRYNIFVGRWSGKENTSGYQNIIVGEQAGRSLETGNKNVFLGVVAGASNVEGNDNVFIGNFAGYDNNSNDNVFIGRNSGLENVTGTGNVFIGEASGWGNEGSGNVFIGRQAGRNEDGSNRLVISNDFRTNPLIYGEFDNGLVEVNGSINLTNILNLKPKTSYPGSPARGDIFYDDNSNSIKYYNGSEWMELSATVSSNLPPSITTDSIPILYILGESAKVYANVTSQGGSAITECGVCYSENPFYDFQFKYQEYPAAVPGEGSFNVTMSFPHYGEYFIRAYATNDQGTSMGEMFKILTAWIEDLPTVETDVAAYNITQTTATVRGDVSLPGGKELTALGVCWSTSPEPTIDNNFTSESIALGEFTSNITGLTDESTYYVRAYATNANGTAYGEEISFTTASYFPVVETDGVVGITQTTAIGGGLVEMPGGFAITAMGVCWSTAPEPTILANDYTEEDIALGVFTSNITGLTAETTYYVRAYATNSYGTSYGNEVIFNAASNTTSISDFEGNIYNTVQIGTQTWMKENLKAIKYNDGSDIPNIIDNTEWINSTFGAFCWYDNDSTTYHETYGTMYNYYAVADSRSLCPTGWHVPTDTEWTELIDYLGGTYIAGGKLRETGTAHWTSDPGVDNSTGFTALPAGYRYLENGFAGIGSIGEWLSSTSEGTKVFARYIFSSNLRISKIEDFKNGAYSVRCIKD